MDMNRFRQLAGLPMIVEMRGAHPADPIEEFVSELTEEIVSIAAKKLDKFGKITADAKSAEAAHTMSSAFAQAMYTYLEASTK